MPVIQLFHHVLQLRANVAPNKRKRCNTLRNSLPCNALIHFSIDDGHRWQGPRASDLLVSIEDEGEEDAAADETALYREYRAYVKDWLEGNADTGKSPLSYEDWKAD